VRLTASRPVCSSIPPAWRSPPPPAGRRFSTWSRSWAARSLSDAWTASSRF